MSTTQRTIAGDLQLPRVIITDPAANAAQWLRDMLGLWQGEWYLDQQAGFPWFQKVLGVKNPNITQIKALLRQAILQGPGIVAAAVDATFDRGKRLFSYNFSATTNTGKIITGGSGTPFIVTGSP